MDLVAQGSRKLRGRLRYVEVASNKPDNTVAEYLAPARIRRATVPVSTPVITWPALHVVRLAEEEIRTALRF